MRAGARFEAGTCVRAILTKLVDENIRNQESLAIVSELHGDRWATGCLDRLREAGYRIRLLLIYCEETVMVTRASRRNLNAAALIERQRAVIDQAALQAAKGAQVELLHSRKGAPCTRTPFRTGRSVPRASCRCGRTWPGTSTATTSRSTSSPGSPAGGTTGSRRTKPARLKAGHMRSG